jgi:hypothetical protein
MWCFIKEFCYGLSLCRKHWRKSKPRWRCEPGDGLPASEAPLHVFPNLPDEKKGCQPGPFAVKIWPALFGREGWIIGCEPCDLCLGQVTTRVS